jgi:hypothetical protein
VVVASSTGIDHSRVSGSLDEYARIFLFFGLSLLDCVPLQSDVVCSHEWTHQFAVLVYLGLQVHATRLDYYCC